ncbi:hypothetical protein RJ641_027762 [Dillenia turbinata]|uniref:Single-stranded DNA binding protein Ssb-like OB fold domain-containing protein n=1 Tax=Dillenia turbinata TaxID=194707 RepID=A0AAN8VYV3_9MAGN
MMKPGTMVILRNAKIDMFKGTMRLAVDKWGRVEVTKSTTFAIKEDNNLSLVEYELVNVVEEWLSLVYLFGKQPPGLPFGTYSQDETGIDFTISELVAEMKPRSSIISYHIADMKDIYYAYERYSNVDAVHRTRFLGLASVRNRDKQKFIHALSPTQASSITTAEICLKPPNTASSPYNVIEKTTHTKEAAENPGASISDLQYWRWLLENYLIARITWLLHHPGLSMEQRKVKAGTEQMVLLYTLLWAGFSVEIESLDCTLDFALPSHLLGLNSIVEGGPFVALKTSQLENLEKETVKWCREILRNSSAAIQVLKSTLNVVDDGHAGMQAFLTFSSLTTK